MIDRNALVRSPTDDDWLSRWRSPGWIVSDRGVLAGRQNYIQCPGFTAPEVQHYGGGGRRMAKKKERESHRNPAILLHDILTSLIKASSLNKHNQRDVLCGVLHVPASDPALLYSRLAELYRLPVHARMALVRAGADPIFLEWADPVDNAISLLNGSPNTNLGGFAKGELPEAVVKLYMCRTIIDAQDSLEMQQLSDVRAAIDSAMSKVAAAEDIDPALSNWLESILKDAAAAIADAEAVGVHAGRDKLCTTIGRTRLTPPPSATTDAEKEVVATSLEVFNKVVTVLHVGVKIAGLLTE